MKIRVFDFPLWFHCCTCSPCSWRCVRTSCQNVIFQRVKLNDLLQYPADRKLSEKSRGYCIVKFVSEEIKRREGRRKGIRQLHCEILSCVERKNQNSCLCMKYPFRALNHNNNKEYRGFKWNYSSVFQDVEIIGTFKWNIQSFAEKDIKESNWVLIIMGNPPPNMLRASASAEKTASTENWLMFWAKDWTVIVRFVGIIF